jgi:hypothetical protein
LKTKGGKGARGSKKTTEKRKPGRKKFWTDEKRADLLLAFQQYIDEHAYPIIQTFCAQHHLWEQRIQEWEEFRDACQICKNKAIAYLRENGTKYSGSHPKLVPSVVIFTLKNIAGWRDNVAIEHSGGIDPVQGMTPEERAKLIEALITKRNVDRN